MCSWDVVSNEGSICLEHGFGFSESGADRDDRYGGEDGREDEKESRGIGLENGGDHCFWGFVRVFMHGEV